MKFASVVFALIGVGGIATVDGMSIRGRGANKLMTFARRLDEDAAEENADENGEESGDENGEESGDENGEENGEDSMYFLADYSIKLLSCIQGEQVINYENGEMESSTVIFRLCPSNSCDADSALGCESGYGDYAVGISTFLEAYMKQQEDNDNYYGNARIIYNQYGQEFDGQEYMECKEYDVEENQNGNQQNQQQQYNNNYNGQYGNNGQQQQNYNGQYGNNGQQQQNNYNNYQDTTFYIGPGCSADGTSIALSMYMNEACSYPAEVNFTQISYGWGSLPFSDGGLVSMDCVACYGPDENYDYELSEMCTETYESSTSRCEENMATYSYYGPVTEGCSYVDTLVSSVYGSATDESAGSYFFSNSTSTTWETISTEVSTRFMDTLSTREARAFIAAMVLFSLSACFGATLITCFCVKKRKERKRAKRTARSAKGNQLLPEAEPKKRRSSVVALVRSGTNSLRESVTSATTGAKVVAATVAAKSVASIKRKSSKKVDAVETIFKTEYKDMEDASVKSVKTQKSVKSRMSNMVKSVTSKKKADDAKSTKSEYEAPEPIISAPASVKSSKSSGSKAATVAPAEAAVAATTVVVKGDASVKSSKSKAASVKSSKSSKSTKYSSIVAAAAPVAATTATPAEKKADAFNWGFGGCGGTEDVTEESFVAEPVASTPTPPAPEQAPVVTEPVVAPEPAPVVIEPVVTESAPEPTTTPEPTKDAEPVEEAAEPVTVETVKQEVELEPVTETEPVKEEAEPVTTPEPAATEPTPSADAADAAPTEETSTSHSEKTEKTKGKKGFLSKMDSHLKKKLSSTKVTV